MKATRARIPLRMLISAYRKAARGGLRIGLRYAAAHIWDSEEQELKPITLRNALRLCVGSDGSCYIDTESIDSGPISRRAFWRLIRGYVQSGFREYNISLRERIQFQGSLQARQVAEPPITIPKCSRSKIKIQVRVEKASGS